MKIQNHYLLLIIGFLFLTNTPVFSQVVTDSIKNDTIKKIIIPVMNDNFYRKPKLEKLRYSFARFVTIPAIEKAPPSCWGKKKRTGI